MAIIPGTSLGDRLRGTNAADTIRGLGGNDFLFGLGGIDTIFGGAGDDTIFGGDAGDTLNGEGGKDTINGENGADTLRGGAGNDTLNGGLQIDRLFGDTGNDTLLGATGDGADKYNGGAGTDTADYSKVTGAAGVGVSLAGAASSGVALGDTFTSIENVTGTKNFDIIFGNTAANRLEGGGAGDILGGAGGADKLFGGDGNDILGPGADTAADAVNGGDGFDTVSYDDATVGVTVNLITGAAGGGAVGDTFASVEWVLGSNQADTLTPGFSGIANGGAGNDILSGSLAPGILTTEFLIGGVGDDTFVLHRGSGADIIDGFVTNIGGAGEQLQVSAAEFANVAYESSGFPFFINTIVNNVTNGIIQADKATPQFIFDQINQTLYFDADGNLGVFAPELIAIFLNHTGGLQNGGGLLGTSDFVIV